MIEDWSREGTAGKFDSLASGGVSEPPDLG
jgi:hypothetical protein